MVNQFVRGIKVDEENLAVDIIHQVGPGGHFMEEDHTNEHFREVWYSDLFDRSNYTSWLKAGGRRFEERLKEKTLDRMAELPEPLPEEILKELERMAAHWK
jgi:trimethylamine--corrinoid protein Co-methyltransferase